MNTINLRLSLLNEQTNRVTSIPTTIPDYVLNKYIAGNNKSSYTIKGVKQEHILQLIEDIKRNELYINSIVRTIYLYLEGLLLTDIIIIIEDNTTTVIIDPIDTDSSVKCSITSNKCIRDNIEQDNRYTVSFINSINSNKDSSIVCVNNEDFELIKSFLTLFNINIQKV